MRALLILLLALAGGPASAQVKTITMEEAGKHVGDSVQFCATVLSFRYFVQVQGKPTVFHFGKPYPDYQLAVVIWEKDRKHFPKPVELMYGNSDVCVRGKVTLVDGRPHIEVSSPEQIGLKEEED